LQRVAACCSVLQRVAVCNTKHRAFQNDNPVCASVCSVSSSHKTPTISSPNKTPMIYTQDVYFILVIHQTPYRRCPRGHSRHTTHLWYSRHTIHLWYSRHTTHLWYSRYTQDTYDVLVTQNTYDIYTRHPWHMHNTPRVSSSHKSPRISSSHQTPMMSSSHQTLVIYTQDIYDIYTTHLWYSRYTPDTYDILVTQHTYNILSCVDTYDILLGCDICRGTAVPSKNCRKSLKKVVTKDQVHPKTLIEIAMLLSTNSGSFPSNSHLSATFPILLRLGEFWNPTNFEKFNSDGSLMGRTNLDKSVW